MIEEIIESFLLGLMLIYVFGICFMVFSYLSITNPFVLRFLKWIDKYPTLEILFYYPICIGVGMYVFMLKSMTGGQKNPKLRR